MSNTTNISIPRLRGFSDISYQFSVSLNTCENEWNEYFGCRSKLWARADSTIVIWIFIFDIFSPKRLGFYVYFSWNGALDFWNNCRFASWRLWVHQLFHQVRHSVRRATPTFRVLGIGFWAWFNTCANTHACYYSTRVPLGCQGTFVVFSGIFYLAETTKDAFETFHVLYCGINPQATTIQPDRRLMPRMTIEKSV